MESLTLLFMELLIQNVRDRLSTEYEDNDDIDVTEGIWESELLLVALYQSRSSRR